MGSEYRLQQTINLLRVCGDCMLDEEQNQVEVIEMVLSLSEVLSEENQAKFFFLRVPSSVSTHPSYKAAYISIHTSVVFDPGLQPYDNAVSS